MGVFWNYFRTYSIRYCEHQLVYTVGRTFEALKRHLVLAAWSKVLQNLRDIADNSWQNILKVPWHEYPKSAMRKLTVWHARRRE